MKHCIACERDAIVTGPEITDLCISLSGCVFQLIECLGRTNNRYRIEEDVLYFHELKEWICKRMHYVQHNNLRSSLQVSCVFKMKKRKFGGAHVAHS